MDAAAKGLPRASDEPTEIGPGRVGCACPDRAWRELSGRAKNDPADPWGETDAVQ
jgi:hypothetical protein